MPRIPPPAGIATWQVGVVQEGARPDGHFEQGAKGVDGGAVRLVGAYSQPRFIGAEAHQPPRRRNGRATPLRNVGVV
jgi:hypothetical protein